MPRNGSGTFSFASNTFYPPTTGVTVTTTDANTSLTDIQSELTNSVAADGQTPMTGPLNMGNNKVTSLANPTASGDAANLGTVQSQIDTRLVSGRVNQVYSHTDPGTSTTSSSFAGITTASASITPVSSSSTLIVEVSFQAIVTASGSGLNSEGGYRIYNSTAAADVGTEYTFGTLSATGANLQTKGPVTIRAVVSNSSTTDKSFVLRAHQTVGSPTVYGTNQVWTITEVEN